MERFWKELNLWDHQVKGVQLGQRYLNAYQHGTTDKSALIRMPTGTGKTGVIAVIARLLFKNSSVLLLAPAAALRDQLAREVKERFWAKIGAEVHTFPAEVVTITPSTTLPELQENSGKRTIFVSTIQGLTFLYRDKRYSDAYLALAKQVKFVIFDEGHREPARIWAQAVRNLVKPVILFTATPYRNDFAFFNIDSRYTYTLPYQKAVENRYIRRVEFVEEDLPHEPVPFVKRLVSYYDQDFAPRVALMVTKDELVETTPMPPRVIVRCHTKSDVIDIANALKAEGKSVVAVHERFSASKEDDGNAHHYKQVPDPRKNEAIFWVHQYKLLEGIDNPSFQLLAIYDRFASSRSLVQQVGRILRNPKRLPDQIAVVLARRRDGQGAYWSRYEEFEKSYASHFDPRDLYEEALRSQDIIRYIDGNYRKRFDITQSDVHRAFRYRCSTTVFYKTKSFDLRRLVDTTLEEWEKIDREIGNVVYPDDKTAVIAYIVQQNSPILLEDYFIELELGFTIIRIQREFVFCYDTRGSIPLVLREQHQKISPVQLARLFSGSDARASSLSLLNSDVGQRSIRRRSIYAYNIADTAPMLTDHGYFYSTLEGRTRDPDGSQVGRYLGFTRGRISDRVGGTLDYKNYIKWIDDLALVLVKEGIRPNELLNRYAVHVDVPDDPTPRHILLDIRDLITAGVYHHVETGNLLEIDDLSMNVKDNAFVLRANEVDYDVNINFDGKTQKYRLSCNVLNNAYTPTPGHLDRYQRGLVSHLNVSQSFRVVPNAEWAIYAHAKFYQPRRSFGGPDDERLELLKIFVPIAELDDIDSEKGPLGSAKLAGWHESSVFHVIDVRGKDPTIYKDKLADALGNTDILICDDLGSNECADFIAASNREQRVIFIHVKAKEGILSASSFQDVCGQVVKNLEPLIPYYNYQPPNLKLWDGPWIRDETKGDIVKQRIRKGEERKAEELWGSIRDIIRNPTATREVWIVYGKGFSLRKFEEQLHLKNPRPEAVNLVYLLQSTWASVASIGARLRIFCPDKKE